jgi:thioredoxin-related protein
LKKIFLILVFAISTFASSLSFVDAMQKAKKENKMVLAVLKTETCPYCDKLKKDLTQDFVKGRLEKDYVITFIDRDNDSFPKELYSRLVPMSYFIDPKNNEVRNQVTGYMNPWQFMDIAKNSAK